MTSLTVRNLDESVKVGLRQRAALHGWSMEQEVRDILQRAAAMPVLKNERSFAQHVQSHFAGLEIDALPIPKRQAARKVPTL